MYDWFYEKEASPPESFFSKFPTREEQIAKLKSAERCDLLIVGGTLLAASLARLAALHGLSVVLVCRNDFATEGVESLPFFHWSHPLCSLKSAKLWQIRSLRENLSPLHVAPHLAFRSEYQGSGSWMRTLISCLAGRGCSPRYREIIVRGPRLVVEQMLAARQEGALTLNYFELRSYASRADSFVECKVENALTREDYYLQVGAIVQCQRLQVDPLRAEPYESEGTAFQEILAPRSILAHSCFVVDRESLSVRRELLPTGGEVRTSYSTGVSPDRTHKEKPIDKEKPTYTASATFSLEHRRGWILRGRVLVPPPGATVPWRAENEAFEALQTLAQHAPKMVRAKQVPNRRYPGAISREDYLRQLAQSSRGEGALRHYFEVLGRKAVDLSYEEEEDFEQLVKRYVRQVEFAVREEDVERRLWSSYR